MNLCISMGIAAMTRKMNYNKQKSPIKATMSVVNSKKFKNEKYIQKN